MFKAPAIQRMVKGHFSFTHIHVCVCVCVRARALCQNLCVGHNCWFVWDTIMLLHRWIYLIRMMCHEQESLLLLFPLLSYLPMVKINVQTVTSETYEIHSWNFVAGFLPSGRHVMKQESQLWLFLFWVIYPRSKFVSCYPEAYEMQSWNFKMMCLTWESGLLFFYVSILGENSCLGHNSWTIWKLHTVFDLITTFFAKVFQNYWKTCGKICTYLY